MVLSSRETQSPLHCYLGGVETSAALQHMANAFGTEMVISQVYSFIIKTEEVCIFDFINASNWGGGKKSQQGNINRLCFTFVFRTLGTSHSIFIKFHHCFSHLGMDPQGGGGGVGLINITDIENASLLGTEITGETSKHF